MKKLLLGLFLFSSVMLFQTVLMGNVAQHYNQYCDVFDACPGYLSCGFAHNQCICPGNSNWTGGAKCVCPNGQEYTDGSC